MFKRIREYLNRNKKDVYYILFIFVLFVGLSFNYIGDLRRTNSISRTLNNVNNADTIVNKNQKMIAVELNNSKMAIIELQTILAEFINKYLYKYSY